jgi:hypothetical protein
MVGIHCVPICEVFRVACDELYCFANVNNLRLCFFSLRPAMDV